MKKNLCQIFLALVLICKSRYFKENSLLQTILNTLYCQYKSRKDYFIKHDFKLKFLIIFLSIKKCFGN